MKSQLNVFFFIRLSHPTTIRQASNTPRQLNNELNQTLHEVDEDYELEIGNYNPVQTLFHDHGISLISLSSTSYNKIDHHLLQVNLTSRHLAITSTAIVKNEIIFFKDPAPWYDCSTVGA